MSNLSNLLDKVSGFLNRGGVPPVRYTVDLISELKGDPQASKLARELDVIKRLQWVEIDADSATVEAIRMKVARLYRALLPKIKVYLKAQQKRQAAASIYRTKSIPQEMEFFARSARALAVSGMVSPQAIWKAISLIDGLHGRDYLNDYPSVRNLLTRARSDYEAAIGEYQARIKSMSAVQQHLNSAAAAVEKALEIYSASETGGRYTGMKAGYARR